MLFLELFPNAPCAVISEQLPLFGVKLLPLGKRIDLVLASVLNSSRCLCFVLANIYYSEQK